MSAPTDASPAVAGVAARSLLDFRRLTIGLGLVAGELVLASTYVGVPRMRYAGAVVLLFASAVGVLVGQRARDVAAAPGRLLVAPAAIACAGLAICIAAVDPHDPAFAGDVVHALPAWLFGWTWFAFVVGDVDWSGVPNPDAVPMDASDASPRRAALGLAMLSLGLLNVAHWLTLGGGPAFNDGSLYLQQARLFSLSHFASPIPAGLEPFFLQRQMVFEHGRALSQYPPGWPAILFLFDRLGLAWCAASACAAASVVLTFLLGRRLFSNRVGLVAAGLLLFQPVFVKNGDGYLSGASSTLALLGAAWLMLASRDRPDRFAAMRWLAAGLLLGFACAIRPLTGATAGSSLVLWYLLRARLSPRPAIHRVLLLACGAALPLSGLAAYNFVTLGNAFSFGYVAANGSLHQLGFGLRGFIAYGPYGHAHAAAHPFTPSMAVRDLMARLTEAEAVLVPIGLTVPLVVLAVLTGYRLRWATILVFLLLPLGYFFWFWSEMRFYTEILPFVYLGYGGIIEHLCTRARNLRRHLVVFLPAFVLVGSVLSIYGDIGGDQLSRLAFAAVDSLAGAHPLLVFVPGSRGDEAADVSQVLLSTLSVYDAPSIAGRVVVARDLGARDSVLQARLPGHTAVRLSWNGQANRIEVQPLRPTATVDAPSRAAGADP